MSNRTWIFFVGVVLILTITWWKNAHYGEGNLEDRDSEITSPIPTRQPHQQIRALAPSAHDRSAIAKSLFEKTNHIGNQPN